MYAPFVLDLPRSPDSVRVIMQDRTDLAPELRPTTRILEIPLTSVIEITHGFARKVRAWFKRNLRRFGLPAALVAVQLLAKQMGGFDSLEHHQMPLFVGAISSAISTSFKGELGVGTHNFTVTTGDVVKCALFSSAATLGASTTTYSTTNEITGTGYTAGGVVMANATPTTSGTIAIFDWADATWSGATFTANGCQAYNSSKSNKSIFVIAFGADQAVTTGTFTIQWPVADASNAIIRF